jgi:hypothetical protein
MSAVLGLPPYLQFFDSNGDPLAGGKIYTYAAGTTTPKATYTDSTGAISADNPIDLDASGIPDTANGSMWLIGSYKFVVKDSLGNTIRTTDNVTSFSTLAEQAEAFFQSFSGNGTQTAFTLSDDLGTEEKGLMIFVSKGLQSCVTNGTFATDTDWTKGAGWTIGAGVATAAGAISTAISQTAPVTLVGGQAYRVTYTITRSAGGLIPSIGGTAGVERTASGTYNEVIIAGSSQTIAFTGNGFTGTLDTISINAAVNAGYDILPPTAFTVNGTSLTFATAPATGTNNIYVFAPSLLLGAASAAASAAEASATAALASEVAAAASASSAAGYAVKNKWTYSTTTTMADPSAGGIRLNNATLASVTAIAISDQSANSGNPDVSGWINTWDDAGGTNRGYLFLFKDESNFAIYTINAANIDNTTWNQLAVTYATSTGSFSNSDTLYTGFAASGTTTVTGGITALTGEVTASGSGSVAATIANNAVTLAKLATQAANTVLAEATGSTAVPTAVAVAANKFLARSSTGNIAAKDITDFALTLLDDADAATARATLGTGFILQTAQASTSGTEIPFTGIPSTINQITVTFSGVSTNGTSPLLVQLGDSGGYETSGYISEASISTLTGTSTAGILIAGGTQSATDVKTGALTFTRITGNSWVASGTITYAAAGSGYVVSCAGSKTTSATTDRLRVIATNGTDTFDAGEINIAYT